ncbi:permease prefix domain 1-containing protein [Pseudonocardia acaciae]|uniref:permease prefix domain 1-containing protein n=1 Tax=Pseudonocardia acaciae TaxID=551276 RepID=UPI000B264A34|nr:permease prefix domain 1-containing protein [Pseudonocardia acaciae]
MTPDPVEDLLTDLDAELLGPRRERRTLIAEARDGLSDAVSGYLGAGMTLVEAKARAAADFGTVPQLRDAYQDVLVRALGRRLLLPLVAMGFGSPLWDLMFATSGSADRPAGPAWLCSVHDVVNGGAVLVAAVGWVLLRLAARRGRSPRAVVLGLAGSCAFAVLAHLVAAAALLLPQLPFVRRVALEAPLAPVVVLMCASVCVLAVRTTLYAGSVCRPGRGLSR